MSEEILQQQQHSNNQNDKQQNLAKEQIPKELKELETIIEVLPEEKRSIAKGLIIAIDRKASWRGPLPPPDMLKEYNHAVSGGAERIMQMAEKQVEHRMALEKQVVPEDQRQSRNGQTFALIIALSFLAVSGLLIGQGHEVSGTILGSIDLVALVTAFIYGRKGQIRLQ